MPTYCTTVTLEYAEVGRAALCRSYTTCTPGTVAASGSAASQGVAPTGGTIISEEEGAHDKVPELLVGAHDISDSDSDSGESYDSVSEEDEGCSPLEAAPFENRMKTFLRRNSVQFQAEDDNSPSPSPRSVEHPRPISPSIIFYTPFCVMLAPWLPVEWLIVGCLSACGAWVLGEWTFAR